MNAELILFLIEEGYPLDKAKEVAAQVDGTTAAEFALALLEALPGAITVAEAREQAERALAVASPAAPQTSPPVRSARPSSIVAATHDTKEAAYGTYSPVVGPDGLTDKQRNAIGSVGLCPNCQQPKTDHLPGCARVGSNGFEAMDPKATTKSPLPPAV